MPIEGASGERRLWLLVIRRAQQEAEGRRVLGDPPRITTYLARRWLTTCTRDFQLVCEFAGFTPDMKKALHEQETKKWPKN
jgi:hypothetical protein